MRKSGSERCCEHAIYICLFGCWCPSNVLYLNSVECCSPSCIFPLFFLFHVAFSFDHWCSFLSRGFLFLSLNEHPLTLRVHLLFHFISSPSCLLALLLSFFLVFFVAENWNGTRALVRPGVSLDTDTAYCVTMSWVHRWVWFSVIFYTAIVQYSAKCERNHRPYGVYETGSPNKLLRNVLMSGRSGA